MSKASLAKSQSPSLLGMKASLDVQALELLNGRFPNIDVEPYYRVAKKYVAHRTGHSKRHMRDNSALETIIMLTMDAVAAAYVLISGDRTEKKVDRLLKDFEMMIGDYLERIAFLSY
jgi:hypothetical protein